MISRYEAHLMHSSGPLEFRRVAVRRFKTLASAERWAGRVLPPTVTTAARYYQDARREPYVTIRDGKPGAQRTITIVEPEIVLVPSVGELGYW